MVIFQNRYIQAAQELVRLAAGVLAREAGPVETLRAELNAIALRVGLDLDLAFRLTPDSLVMLVAPDDAADPLRARLAAEMFYLAARLAEREGDARAEEESDRRALLLYTRLEPGSPRGLDLPDPAERVRELERRLDIR